MKTCNFKQKEYRLDDSLYMRILDSVNDSVLVLNSNNQILTANVAACSLFGMEKQEIERKSLFSLIDSEGPGFMHLVKQLDQTGKAKGKINFINKNNSLFSGNVTSFGVYHTDGQPITILIIHELNGRNLEEEKMQEDLIRFQTAFDASFDGTWDMDIKTNRLYLSPNALSLFNYNQPMVLNRDQIWEKLFFEQDRLRLEAEFLPLYNGEVDLIDTESRVKTLSGALKWVRIRGKAISSDHDDSIIRILGTLVDITSYKLNEENLKNERIIFKTLVDNLPMTIYIIDKEGRKIISNKADLETIGIQNEADVLGKTDLELYPGEIGERGHADNLFVINNKISIVNRLENFFDKVGRQKWLLTNKIPFLNQYNHVSGLIGFGIDITDLKNLQQKIIDSEAYYRTLIYLSPDGIIVTDKEGNFTFRSKKILEIFDIPENEDIIGKSVFECIVPENQDLSRNDFKELLNGNASPQSKHYQGVKSDKTRFWIELSAAPLFDSSNAVTGIMIICRDISERKKSEEELLTAKNKAEESDRLKSAFIRNISHEIRTPLNAILGFSQILGELLPKDEKILNYMEIINQSGQRLLSIINDLLDVSAIEARVIEQQKSTINLNELLNNLYIKYQQVVNSKNITLNLNNPLSYETIYIITDEKKLSRILSNLINNAFKYTESGHVSFGYSCNNEFLEFYVADTGIGIPAKYSVKIFDIFFQVDNSLTRRFDGTGLGLSICKAYVELLGGSMWFTSKEDEGSTFFFTIPYEQGEKSLLN
jgi:PAS domain S-box-containing protein